MIEESKTPDLPKTPLPEGMVAWALDKNGEFHAIPLNAEQFDYQRKRGLLPEGVQPEWQVFDQK